MSGGTTQNPPARSAAGRRASSATSAMPALRHERRIRGLEGKREGSSRLRRLGERRAAQAKLMSGDVDRDAVQLALPLHHAYGAGECICRAVAELQAQMMRP